MRIEASIDEIYPISIDTSGTGINACQRLHERNVYPHVGEMPAEMLQQFFPECVPFEKLERYETKLLNPPLGTPDEEVRGLIRALEPAGSWEPATPWQMVGYILQHGVHQATAETEPGFYMVGLGGPLPTMFTNVDMDAVMNYLHYSPVIPEMNDYDWSTPDTGAPEHRRDRFYLVVRRTE